MCGVFGIFLSSNQNVLIKEKALINSRLQRHRGPDSTGVYHGSNFAIIQERLSIIGISTGKQPILSDDKRYILAANGEIYNYQELIDIISTIQDKPYIPKSDCDVIVQLYIHFKEKVLFMIWGMFAFIIYDTQQNTFFVARDQLGLCSLYYSTDGSNYIAFSSEIKCIYSPNATMFNPGYYMYGNCKKFEYINYCTFKSLQTPMLSNPNDLLLQLERIVEYHLQSELEIAMCLSGGLYSSILCYLVTKIMKKKKYSYKLKTFTIGVLNSETLQNAKQIADTFQTNHYEIIIDFEESLLVIPELIWYLETDDINIILPAIPMYLLARKVKVENVKVILIGDGFSQLFKNIKASIKDINTVSNSVIHNKTNISIERYNVAIPDKVFLAHSCELRVPFLATPLINYMKNLPLGIELTNDVDVLQTQFNKKYLESIFQNILPNSILLNQPIYIIDHIGKKWQLYLEQAICTSFAISASTYLTSNSQSDQTRNTVSQYFSSIYSLTFQTNNQNRCNIFLQ